MGVVRRLRRLVLLPGDTAAERARKELVLPWYLIAGVLALLWALVRAAELPESRQQLSDGCVLVANAITAGSLLPACAYAIAAKSVPREVCEVSAVVVVVGVVLSDLGHVLQAEPTVVFFGVLALDMLLMASASDAVAWCVVVLMVAWMGVRAVMDADHTAAGHCRVPYARFSADYIGDASGKFFDAALVLLLDFAATRGFAKSMHEQKAMVEASIQLSEAAAVLLSKYETEDTKTLLDGPDGGRLPAGLRQALLQLVTNLALYRPYLPQSCLPSSDGGSDCNKTTVCGSDAQRRSAATHSSSEEGVVAVSSCDVSSSAESDPSRPALLHGLASPGARSRRVSAVAVNSKSFLRVVDNISAVRAFIAAEVGAFVGSVAAERGVVDLVSGDHMYGNFNAARLCTTHKLGAARVAWGATRMTQAGLGRCTGCACSGSVLCGDFGTADARRFMLLGPTFNTMQCLERVAAQLGMVLVDDVVGADADVGSNLFVALVERLHYAKRGPKPFYVWRLVGTREVSDDMAEWMYELARQAHGPHEAWNERLAKWLGGGDPFEPGELDGAPFAFNAEALTSVREQSLLTEATVVGGTVAFTSHVRT